MSEENIPQQQMSPVKLVDLQPQSLQVKFPKQKNSESANFNNFSIDAEGGGAGPAPVEMFDI